jgi:heptosyltransferase-3
MPVERLCLLSARNLGDAVIHASFLKALVAQGYANHYLVWTFDQAAFLFEGIDHCTVVTSQFPMGATGRTFFRNGVDGFRRALAAVRSARPTHTLELVSDVRERAVVRMTGARSHLSIRWSSGHPFRKHNWMSPFAHGATVRVAAGTVSIYDAFNQLFQALCPGCPPVFAASLHRPVSRAVSWPVSRPVASRSIALHPFASLACKLWPDSHWRELMARMKAADPKVRFLLIGAPSDRAKCEALAEGQRASCEIVCGPLPELKARLAEVDLLVGLDSFSVHLGYSVGTPCVMLVGPNDPRIFSPPAARVVTHPGRCAYQPCGGKPKCLATDFQYACMADISAQEVVDAAALRDTRIGACSTHD